MMNGMMDVAMIASSGAAITILSASVWITCTKKKVKPAESACSKPAPLHLPNADAAAAAAEKKDGSKTPMEGAKNSGEKKPEDKKPAPPVAAAPAAPAPAAAEAPPPPKDDKKDEMKVEEKKDEKKIEEKKDEKKPDEGEKTNLKTDKASGVNKADSTHTKPSNSKETVKNGASKQQDEKKEAKKDEKKDEPDDQYQQVDFGPGELPPPPK